jgi:hypothetical protein
MRPNGMDNKEHRKENERIQTKRTISTLKGNHKAKKKKIYK